MEAGLNVQVGSEVCRRPLLIDGLGQRFYALVNAGPERTGFVGGMHGLDIRGAQVRLGSASVECLSTGAWPAGVRALVGRFYNIPQKRQSAR